MLRGRVLCCVLPYWLVSLLSHRWDKRVLLPQQPAFNRSVYLRVFQRFCAFGASRRLPVLEVFWRSEQEVIMAPPVVGRPFTQVLFSEAKRNWPFVFGFATVFSGVLKLSLSLDPKEAQKSPFHNPNAHY